MDTPPPNMSFFQYPNSKKSYQGQVKAEYHGVSIILRHNGGQHTTPLLIGMHTTGQYILNAIALKVKGVTVGAQAMRGLGIHFYNHVVVLARRQKLHQMHHTVKEALVLHHVRGAPNIRKEFWCFLTPQNS